MGRYNVAPAPHLAKFGHMRRRRHNEAPHLGPTSINWTPVFLTTTYALIFNECMHRKYELIFIRTCIWKLSSISQEHVYELNTNFSSLDAQFLNTINMDICRDVDDKRMKRCGNVRSSVWNWRGWKTLSLSRSAVFLVVGLVARTRSIGNASIVDAKFGRAPPLHFDTCNKYSQPVWDRYGTQICPK